MCSCRSIQKLEELNVGMDDLGEEVQALSLQCNGGGGEMGKSTSSTTDSLGPQDIRNSTPQRTGVRGAVHPPTESPVLPQR